MKKDIEWLKGRFRGRKIFKPQNDREIGYNMAIDEFSEYVVQLDKLEVLSPDWIHDNSVYASSDGVTEEYVHVDELKELIMPKQEITYEDVLKAIAENIGTDEFSIGLYLEALNNNEKYEFLTEKWIEDNTSPVDDEGRLYVWKRDLQNVIVPKQEDMFNGEKPDEGEVYFAIGLGGAVEVNVARSIDEAIEILTEHETNYSVSIKTVIPKFVAEWIEKYIEYGYDLYPALKKMENNSRSWERIYDWYRNNTLEFVLAYLTQEYEIEEEQKYVVKLPMSKNNDNQYAIVDYSGNIWIDALPSKYKLTEEEIRGLTKGDVLFEYFSVKAEELEE